MAEDLCWDFHPGGDFCIHVPDGEPPKYSAQELSESFAQLKEGSTNWFNRWTPDTRLLEGRPPEGLEELLREVPDWRDVLNYIVVSGKMGDDASGTSVVLDPMDKQVSGPKIEARKSSEDNAGSWLKRLAGCATGVCGARLASTMPCLPQAALWFPTTPSAPSAPVPPQQMSQLRLDESGDELEVPRVSEDMLQRLLLLFPDFKRPVLANTFADNHGNFEDTVANLQKLRTWRQKMLPVEQRSIEQRILNHRKLYIMGKDLWGHPVILFMGNRHQRGDTECNIRLFVHFMEEAIQSMEEGIFKVTLLLCLDEGSQPDLDFISGLRTMVQTYYPGRIWRVIVFPTGVMSGWLWSIASVALDAHSRRMIKLMPAEGGLKTEGLLEYFAPDQLLVEYGGTLRLSAVERRCYGGASSEGLG
mmetsp:Transcript_7809/g.17309  ORF Transcript_7809/g.17309 Transcript_7809/m.17309 type:complete len:417 (+) Transcript_7809:64-1314(+)